LDQEKVLREPFNIDTHKNTFKNYLEVLVLKSGRIVYAVPSHQIALVRVFSHSLGHVEQIEYGYDPKSIWKHIPQQVDVMQWLVDKTGVVSLWDTTGYFPNKGVNRAQYLAIKRLKHHGLYKGELPKEYKEGGE